MAFLHPQECYLLEQFISVAAYKQLCSIFDDLVLNTEEALSYCEYSYHRQRKKGISSYQDAHKAWQNWLMPQFYSIRDNLHSLYQLRAKDDPIAFQIDCLRASMTNINRLSWDWMTSREQKNINILLNKSYLCVDAIRSTINRQWTEGSLTYLKNNHSSYKITLFQLPKLIPKYRLVPNIRMEIGQPPPVTGLYLPGIPDACAQFFHIDANISDNCVLQGVERESFMAHPYLDNPSQGWYRTTLQKTGWTLIEKQGSELISVPKNGFFPQGLPDELYQWSESNNTA